MILRLLIIVLIALSSYVYAAQIGDTGVVLYDQPHFSVEIPSPYEKHTLTTTTDESVYDIYSADGRAYAIRVIKAPDELPASTAIEKIIQEKIKSSSKLGSIKRWEMDSRDKILFKGYTRLADINEPFLISLLGESKCIECVSMAALGDEFSPIVSVGVMGRIDQSDDIENLAKYLAFAVCIIPDKPALSASPGKLLQRSSPILRSDSFQPKYSSKPKPADPSVQQPQKLKKGEIKLEGTVESISRDSSSLVMQVSDVTMPGSKPITPKPSRQKTVFFDKLPFGVIVGSRIVAIGNNDGIGSPIRAVVQVLH